MFWLVVLDALDALSLESYCPRKSNKYYIPIFQYNDEWL